MVFRQLVLELDDIGVGTHQLLADRNRVAEGHPCAGPIARAGEQRAEIVIAIRQVVLVHGDGRVVVNQFLPDRKCLIVGRPRTAWVAILGQNDAHAHLGPGHVDPKLSDV